MGFVHGEKGRSNGATGEIPGQPGQPLRGGIEETNRPGAKLLQHRSLFRSRQRAVERGGGKAPRAGGGHLILHEGDQRGDDQGRPVTEEGGNLKADRLPTPGGQHGEDVAAFLDRGDHPALEGAERGVTKMAVQQGLKGNGSGHPAR